MNKKFHRQNIAAGALVAAVGAVAFALTFGMPGNASVFPRVASGLLFLLGFLLSALAWRDLRRGREGEKKPADSRDFINPLYSTILMVLYVVGIPLLGFYASTVLMLFAYMRHLGMRSLKTMALTTVLVSALVYFVFSVQLGVPLPNGLLP